MLSYKSLTAWKWIKTNCDKNLIRFVIKLDDDVVLNSIFLKNIIGSESDLNIEKQRNSFYGTVFSGFITDKNVESKYYVTDSEYNSKLYGLRFYSDYCFGPGSMMTSDLIEKLFAKAYDLKLFWLDDAYVGILGRYTNGEFVDADKELFFDYKKSTNLAGIDLTNILFVRNADTKSIYVNIWEKMIS